MTSKQEVMQALKEVIDPELGVSIVDLGLIYGVRVEGDKAVVKMTLTMPTCPMASIIASDAEEKVKAVEGISEAKIEIVFDPPWKPELMSEGLKKKFGF